MMVRRLSELVVRAEPLLVAVLLPMLLLPTPARPVALLVLLAPWFCARFTEGHFLRLTPLDWLVLLLAGNTLVSLVIAPDRAYALSPTIGIAYGLIVYYAIVRYARDGRALRKATWVFVLIGVGLALVGLVGTDWQCFKFNVLCDLIQHLPAANLDRLGFRINPNGLGGALAFFVPVQVLLVAHAFELVSRKRAGRRRAYVSLAAQLVFLVATGSAFILAQSRAAWFGLFGAFGAYLAWHGQRTAKGLLFILLLCLVAMVIIGPQAALATLTQDPSQVEETLTLRLSLWAEAVDAIRHFPITGFGLRDFSSSRPNQVPSQFAAWPNVYFGHPHNVILQVALAVGIPGLIAYLALWLGAAAMLVSVRRVSPDPWLHALADGLAAGLLTYFIFGLADTITFNPKVGVVYWLTLGLVAGVHRVASADGAAGLLDPSATR